MQETDIRPEKLFREYLRLSSQDAELCFSDVDREFLNCPACDGDARHEFSKHGFDYATCGACATLFQNPRPVAQAFEDFYRNSKSSQYWAQIFFPAVAESRRAHIFLPRVERLNALFRRGENFPQTVMDVGAGYGIFLEEWQRRCPSVRAIAVEPSGALAHECRRKGLEVIEQTAEKIDDCRGAVDLLTCFEVLEHVHDPLLFLRALRRFIAPAGRIALTTLGVDGFDIQLLWEKSRSVSPPHHINFFSKQGFRTLFRRAGFAQIEIFTPGKLDVDIVRNAAKEDASILENSRFLKKMIDDAGLANRFQDFLEQNGLSSHVWILAVSRI